MAKDEEEERLRKVALRNAQSILVARQRADEALRKQTDWLQVTLSSIGDAVISTNAEGRVTFMNGVAEALTGYTSAEALHRPLADVFHLINEQTREPAENPVPRVLREGVIAGLPNQTVLVARDGTERPIDDSAAPMRDESGAPIGAVLIFRDVSERRRTEEERARLAAIVESSDDAIVSKTLEGIIRTWNVGAKRLFGYTASEVVGQPITIIIPPERLDEERAILERLRRGERVDHFETVRVAKDGRRLDISLTVSPIRDRDGRIIGASKIARDITLSKKAEKALREQAQLLRQLAQAALTIHSADSLDSALRVVAEEARRILDAHQAVVSLSVWDGSAQAINAVSLSEKYARWRGYDILPGGEGICSLACQSNRPLRLTQAEVEDHPAWRNFSGEADRRPPLRGLLAAPLVSRAGKNLGLVQLSDKEHGEFSENDEAVLVQLAHIASVAIENARLYTELRDQDRRKDEFLALLAHELRNPLAPLRSGLEVIRLADGERQVVGKARGMMERQLAHMVRLIDDLLDIARINRNKLELRRSKVLLANVVTSAVETTRPMIDAAAHELTVSIPPHPVYLDADLTRLAQVVANLLSNSAKYTRRGGHIWLGAEVLPNEVQISVRDDGVGIPAEYLETIFDMFAQVDRNMEGSNGGLGIGLALVRGLVQMHGGTVKAESPGPGKGSTFTVRLPLLGSFAESPSEALAHAQSRAPRPKRRILVVDDNQDAAASMALMLTLMNNDVRTAHDGREAVAAAEAYRPHAILMDIGMPGLNGYEAARRIREQPWAGSTLLVALSGWGQEGDKERSQQAGFDRHLVKPVEPAALEEILSTLEAGA
jgi:PAS domain S-box-containing protein